MPSVRCRSRRWPGAAVVGPAVVGLAGCRGRGAVRQGSRGAELRLTVLRVEARLLSQMVSVDDKSPALDHGSRHLEVLGAQIEIGEQRDEVGGEA